MNLSALRADPDGLARFLGLMLVAWQPFVSGARLPSLLLLLVGGWMLLNRSIDWSAQPVRRLGLLFLLLGLPMLLSVPGSYAPMDSIELVLALALFYVAGLALLRGLATAGDRAWLLRWLAIVLAVWVVDGLAQFLFGRDLLGIPMNEEGRIVGPFPDNLHYGIFITVLMPAILWPHAAERPLMCVGVIGLVGFLAAMSGARSNVLFFLLASALLFFRFPWKIRLALIVAMAVGMLLALQYSALAPAKVEASLAQAQHPEEGAFERIDRALSGRLTIWETAWHMLRDRPLTGVGASAFAEAYDHYSTRPDDPFHSRSGWTPYHAHQMYVSVAAESGVIGLAGLLVAVGLLVTWYYRAPYAARQQAAQFAAPLAVVAFPIQSQPILYTLWWFPVLLLLVCGMLAALDTPDNVTDESSS